MSSSHVSDQQRGGVMWLARAGWSRVVQVAKFPKRLYRRFVTKPKYRQQYGWHRQAAGAKWEKMGPAQLAYLVSMGMKPHHKLLDIGCGPLRGGIHFIGYLDAGNYYGMDKEESLLEAARNVEIPRNNLQHKSPNIIHIENFEISSIGIEFDYMFSHSVFSHLSPEQIEMCLDRVLPWLKPGGAYYVDFKEDERTYNTGPHEWRRDEISSAFYTRSFFEELAARKGYDMTYIGRWPNPTKDSMLRFGRLQRR